VTVPSRSPHVTVPDAGPLRMALFIEREQAVGALRNDLLAGRLTLDEFSDRVLATV
jgi:hypothetical protein